MSTPYASLRRATMEDARQIFQWRNDPWIVSLGTNQQTVSWEEHEQWLRRVLGDADHHMLYIIESECRSLGVVRLDREEETAATTIYLDRGNTGRGFGVQALRQACAAGFRRWPIRCIDASIRRDNDRSLRAFAKAGFFANGDGSKETVRCRLEKPENYQKRLKAFYHPRLEAHGADARAAGWGSAEGQASRLRILLAVADIQHASVLDIGCGLGHLVDELKAQDFQGTYRGIDLLETMVSAANSRHPSRDFAVEDVGTLETESADFVIASGLFTFADEPMLRETVAAMFHACRHAVAFNSLSTKADRREPGEFHADPDETREFCKSVSPHVVLRHDYMPHDFTIYMYRQPQGS